MSEPVVQRRDPVVIVGAGHAGVQVAARLAELGHEHTVLLDEEGGVPYERPPLSKDVLAGGGLRPLRRPGFYADKGIALRAGHVVALHRDRREIELASGEHLGYSGLVLATGSRPRTLDVPGADLPGVQLLKTPADALALRERTGPGCQVVVVGAGYIGLEAAAAATAAGSAVTVLEAQDRVMARVTSEPVSRFFTDLHRDAGTRLVFDAGVTEFEGDGRVEYVVTAAGERIPADVVVVGVGVVPHQEIAEAAGIACADGVLVDEFCRTSDPHVYAIGDVARTGSVDGGGGVRLESVQNAVGQALTAAAHIATGEPIKPEVPWFWTIQHGVRLQTAGLREPGDDVVVRGEPASRRFSVLYLRDGRLAAVDTVGSLKDFVPGRKLIASGDPVDRDLVADPSVALGRTRQLVGNQ